jgi:hypothetical protein
MASYLLESGPNSEKVSINTASSGALRLVSCLNNQLWNVPIPESKRSRLAASCFAVSLEHHHAIAILVENKRTASAIALVRSEYESYLRGMWLFLCAPEEEVDKLAEGNRSCKFPKIRELITAVESASESGARLLSQLLHEKNYHILCDYTHTGSLQIQRWNSVEAIEPTYSPEEIDELIRVSNHLAILAALSVAAVAENEKLSASIMETAEQFIGKPSPGNAEENQV